MIIKWKLSSWAGLVSGFCVLVFFGTASFAEETVSDACIEVSAGLEAYDMEESACLSPESLKGLMDKPFTLDGMSALKVSHPENVAEQATVSTCSEYAVYQADGWFALSQRDMDKEVRIQRQCGLLVILASAKQASTSYLKEGDGLHQLERLPRSFLLRFEEADDAGEQGLWQRVKLSLLNFQTVQGLVDDGDCQVQETTAKDVRLTYDNIDAVYRELARADIDGNGTEDLLVSAVAKPVGGSAVVSKLFVLSTYSDGGRFRIVDVEPPFSGAKL